MCGIVAYLGKNKPNIDKFKLLLLLNKERGTDATGLAFNNFVFKTTESVDKFLSTNLFNIPDTKGTLVGHVRQSSKGWKTIGQAHPIPVYSGNRLFSDLSKEEKEELLPEFVLVMNGTVRNIEDLSKEYDTKYKNGESDTEHIALILHKLGKNDYMQFFSKYIGACTSVFYWTDEPNNVYISKDIERPLFVYSDKKGDIWLSSIKESLTVVKSSKNAEDYTLETFDDNYVHIYKNSKLIESVKYEKAEEEKKETHYNTRNYHTNKPVIVTTKSTLTATTALQIKNSKSCFGVNYVFNGSDHRCYEVIEGDKILMHGAYEIPVVTTDNRIEKKPFNFIFGNQIEDVELYLEMLDAFPVVGTNVKEDLLKYELKFNNFSLSKKYKGKFIGRTTSSIWENGADITNKTFEFDPISATIKVNSLDCEITPYIGNLFKNKAYMGIDDNIINVFDIVTSRDRIVWAINDFYKDCILELAGAAGTPEYNNSILEHSVFMKHFLYYVNEKELINNISLLNYLWYACLDQKENPELEMVLDELTAALCNDTLDLLNFKYKKSDADYDLYSTFYMKPRQEFFDFIEESLAGKAGDVNMIAAFTMINLEVLTLEECVESLAASNVLRVKEILNKSIK